MNALACVLLVLFAAPQKTPTLGSVESTFDKSADFTKLRTYAWNRGQEAFDPRAHKVIVDAVDAQMASLGFTKAPEASADVIVKYHSVRGTYVDLKSLEKSQKQGPIRRRDRNGGRHPGRRDVPARRDREAALERPDPPSADG
jgi:hypothetical protein